MVDAIIGHTGFVGGNIAAQRRFHAWFNSKNIELIRGQRFGLLVVSAMPAAKWLANRDPVADRAALERLWENLARCQADEAIIISTVDVYPTPIGVDEDTFIEPTYQHPYGKHRLELERRAEEHFPKVLAVRLPALYGPGLKKNAVYDLLHGNETHKVPTEGSFQFYNLDRIWQDIGTARAAGLTLANFATEPVTIRDVARQAFGFDFANPLHGLPPRYDVHTKHAALFGGQSGYLESRDEVLAGLRAFVAAERRSFPMRAAA
jgi:hypothetical protein